MRAQIAFLAIVASLVMAAPPAGAVVPADISDQVKDLPLRQLLGQRVIASYPGHQPPQALLDAIARGEVGGVIFFGANVAGNAQIRAVTRQLQRTRKQGPVPQPLLLMTDQEGGIVRRIPGAPVLSAKAVGLAPLPLRSARHSGNGAGSNLAAAGVNLNLAPVLDVFRQPGNFIDQFGRSFGSDPFQVAALGSLFLTSQQPRGIAATSKHFPGLGAAPAGSNTDLSPLTLDLPLSELRAVDMVPFEEAIAAGTSLVMASWAIYPALDPVYPAGLSRTIVRGELRDRLGFRGVTITDALEAGAIAPFGSIPERGVLAAQAGMDLLLYSARDVSEATTGLDGLVAAVQGGDLKRSRVRNAVARILMLRDQLRVNPGPPVEGP